MVGRDLLSSFRRLEPGGRVVTHHEVINDELQEEGLLDLDELAIDATFVDAQKKGSTSEPRKAGSATRSRC